ncbi:uncharacterized protein LOC108142330 [Drosophila elegans]|uniref:uncharacterized protein LOC108142330 n=1 Tax=Drosophila elegans TaxID=30023 RepID=UPI0007E7DBC0|nr:uncharacterized protein LOC108142330 [Drosophila elegans]
MNRNNQASDSSWSEPRSMSATNALIDAIRNSRRLRLDYTQGTSNSHIDCPYMAAVRDQIRGQRAMDRLLNTKLDRDKLPEDTPLPIYLAHREPRSISPPSKWDKPIIKKQKTQ